MDIRRKRPVKTVLMVHETKYRTEIQDKYLQMLTHKSTVIPDKQGGVRKNGGKRSYHFE